MQPYSSQISFELLFEFDKPAEFICFKLLPLLTHGDGFTMMPCERSSSSSSSSSSSWFRLLPMTWRSSSLSSICVEMRNLESSCAIRCVSFCWDFTWVCVEMSSAESRFRLAADRDDSSMGCCCCCCWPHDLIGVTDCLTITDEVDDEDGDEDDDDELCTWVVTMLLVW